MVLFVPVEGTCLIPQGAMCCAAWKNELLLSSHVACLARRGGGARLSHTR